MEASEKAFYEVPEAVVFEVKTEGAILQVSGDPQITGFGNEIGM